MQAKTAPKPSPWQEAQIGGPTGRWVVMRVLSLRPPMHEYIKSAKGDVARFKSQKEALAAELIAAADALEAVEVAA